MINIKKLYITKDLKNIVVDIESMNLQSNFIKMYFWDTTTFRNYEKVVDLSNRLLRKNHKESLTISAEELGMTLFSGIFFLEFRTNQEPSYNSEGQPSNQTLGLVANLFKYKECLLNKTVSVKVSGCGKVEDECRDCQQNLCLLHTFIGTLDTAILEGYLEEAVKIAKDIEDMCDICHTCPDYGDTYSYNGKGLMYQIIDNEILSKSVVPKVQEKIVYRLHVNTEFTCDSIDSLPYKEIRLDVNEPLNSDLEIRSIEDLEGNKINLQDYFIAFISDDTNIRRLIEASPGVYRVSPPICREN